MTPREKKLIESILAEMDKSDLLVPLFAEAGARVLASVDNKDWKALISSMETGGVIIINNDSTFCLIENNTHH